MKSNYINCSTWQEIKATLFVTSHQSNPKNLFRYTYKFFNSEAVQVRAKSFPH